MGRPAKTTAELEATLESLRSRFRLLPLAALPTPVEPLTRLSSRAGAEIAAKRDDRTATVYGGNKVRKLEGLFAEAERRGATHVLTAGAAGSHHVLATALHGRARGLAVTAVLVPQPRTVHVARTLRATVAAGAHLVGAPAALLPVVAAAAAVRIRLREGRAAYWIPLGGSSVAGALGYVLGGLELGLQIARGEAPAPEAIFVALGTGGTAVGLAFGLAAAGLDVPVHAVQVVGPFTLRLARVGALERGVRRALETAGISAKMRPLVVVRDQLGAGYGHPTPAGERAIQMAEADEGLRLEPTYTGKTFAALLRFAEGAGHGKRLLYWHTLSAVEPPVADDAAVAALPSRLRRFA